MYLQLFNYLGPDAIVRISDKASLKQVSSATETR